MRVVLSDTSPIHYLVLIGEVEVLRKLYGRVLIPSSVAYELDRPQTPSMVQAQEFIDAYFAGFPRVRAFIDRTLEEGRATGIVKTMYGRKRLMPELREDRADEIAALVRDRMQSATRLAVPLTVDIGIGPNWKDAKH